MKNIIKNQIKNLADKEYKEFHSKLCPGTNNILGVRIPILRKYAKDLAKEYEIRELLKEIDTEYYEEVMLSGMLIGLEKGNIEEILEDIKGFIPKIDNWAVCDIFCGGLKITKNYKKEMWNFIQKYLESNKEFEVRFGVVMILSYYIEEEYIEKIFKIFDKITNIAYYVQMAVAWAISICLIKFYDRTVEYLKKATIDDFTYNKALQKATESYRITAEKKIELRNMKK